MSSGSLQRSLDFHILIYFLHNTIPQMYDKKSFSIVYDNQLIHCF